MKKIVFKKTIGQEETKNKIITVIEKAKLPHALLFSGPAGSGKLACAVETGMALLCGSPELSPCYECASCRKVLSGNHPDFYVSMPFFSKELLKKNKKDLLLEPEQEEMDYNQFYSFCINRAVANPYSIPSMLGDLTFLTETVSEIQNDISTPPSQGAYKIFILYKIESMNKFSANRLLKIIEEPPHYAIFILTSNNPYNLLQTIKSRCHIFRFRPLGYDLVANYLVEKFHINKSQAEKCSFFSGGNISKAVSFLDSGGDKDFTLAFDFFKVLSSKSYKTLIDYYERALSTTQNSEQMKSFMELILILGREIYIFNYNNSPNSLIRKELENSGLDLKKYNESFFTVLTSEIKKVLKALDLNINLQRTFLNLLLKLKLLYN